MKLLNHALGIGVHTSNGFGTLSEDMMKRLGFVEEKSAPPGIIEIRTSSTAPLSSVVLNVEDQIKKRAAACSENYNSYLDYHLNQEPKSTVHAIREAYGQQFRVGDYVHEPASYNEPFNIDRFIYCETEKKWFALKAGPTVSIPVNELKHCNPKPILRYFRMPVSPLRIWTEIEVMQSSIPRSAFVEVEVKEKFNVVRDTTCHRQNPISKYFR